MTPEQQPPIMPVSKPAPTPSSQRVVPGSVNLPPAPWPKTATTPTDSIDAPAIAQRITAALNDALAQKDHVAAAALFLPDGEEDDQTNDDGATGFWRDHLMLSFQLRTLKGREKIAAYLKEEGQKIGGVKLAVDASSDFRKPKVVGFRPLGEVKGVEFFVKAESEVGRGRGVVRLVEHGGEWKIWTVFTTLEGLTGVEEKLGPRREVGVQHGGLEGRKNWRERREEEGEMMGSGPEVLVIGAGQAGLTVAARLKVLGVPTLTIDKNRNVGDSWRQRYHQLVLHDPVWYDHLPYMPFPETWPVFTPKDKLADWFESYVKALELDIWTGSYMVDSSWNEAKKEWTVVIARSFPNGQCEDRTFHPKHIIIATGHSGRPYMPDIPGEKNFRNFRGSGLYCHSADFPGAKPGQGKKAVVVGACNSSMDICQDYVEKGWDVTLVQRSSTYVVSSEGVLEVSLGGLYEEGGPPAEDSDIAVWGWPSEVLKSIQVDLTTQLEERDKDLLDGLDKAGFKTDRGPHGGGLFCKYLQRGGGYYIDVGGAKLIIDGKVKVKHGQEVAKILPRGLRLAGGTDLEADEIIFATGYENMRTTAKDILQEDLSDQVGDIWGWDQEGEPKTIWTNSGQPGLWFHGGNLALCRYYSRLVALQIVAKLKGIDKRA
ncbi:hypothetical protein VTI74DRAFT_7430 [Chaetomium olivicolor]